MFGHANPVIVEAICEQLARGATTMLPTEDSVWVGEALGRPLRSALLAIDDFGHRRESLHHPAVPDGVGPGQGDHFQL